MDLEQVKEFLEKNKDDKQVKEYLKGFSSINEDEVKAYLESDDGKRLLQPKLDSYFSKGLTTWQENNLQKLVDEEVKKRNPELTPEQIELQQIKQQLAEMENQKTRESLKNKALTVASEKSIPTSMIDYLIGQDEESTIKNLSTFETAMKAYVDKQVNARINDSSYTPPSGDSNSKKTFTVDQVKAMSEEEITKNWDAVQDTLSSQQQQ